MSDFGLRRQARLRREFLYRKNIEKGQRSTQNKKNRVVKAVEGGKEISSKLKGKALRLLEAAEYDDAGPSLAAQLGGGAGNKDDEYRWAGVEDPKIVITTSHDPSSKLKQFAKEIKLLLPNSQRMNRGKYETKQLIEACRANQVTDFIVLHETRGRPDAMVVCHLPHGPTAYFNLADVVMRHDIPDIGTMSEQFPHLIFHNFKSKLGLRTKSILKYLFPVPKEDSTRVVTYVNLDDWILFRQHTYKITDGGKEINLHEIGPRFSMKLYRIINGTLDEAGAVNTEFVLRPYMNTAKKQRYMSDKDPW